MAKSSQETKRENPLFILLAPFYGLSYRGQLFLPPFRVCQQVFAGITANVSPRTSRSSKTGRNFTAYLTQLLLPCPKVTSSSLPASEMTRMPVIIRAKSCGFAFEKAIRASFPRLDANRVTEHKRKMLKMFFPGLFR